MNKLGVIWSPERRPDYGADRPSSFQVRMENLGLMRVFVLEDGKQYVHVKPERTLSGQVNPFLV